jgi:hypothetical protein
MRAKVLEHENLKHGRGDGLPGFVYHRRDNTPVYLKPGDEFDANDMVPRDREARVSAGHIELIDEKAPEVATEAAPK